MPTFTHLKPPTTGTAITKKDGRLIVPDDPIIPFIEGDGTGPDIWRASVRVFDAAVEKAYGGKRKIEWVEVFAGEKSFKQFNTWLPDDTVEAFRHYLVGIKGPLTTPVGGGIRSLNVALRQMLDLFVCLRPVRWYRGVPSPVKHPEKVDMVIFRENTEDIYAGIEYAAGTPEAQKILDFFAREFPKEFKKIRFGTQQAATDWQAMLQAIGAPVREVGVQVGVGLKPISYLGTERLVHSAISYAITNQRKSVTLVHKGNIMKFTEGAFRDWGYEVAKSFFGAEEIDGGPWCRIPDGQAGRRHRDQGCDCRHHAAAGADAAGRVRRYRHAQSERRLPVGRAGGAGRWHRDRAGRQHQLRDRPRGVRGHARHRPQVREPGQGQSRLGDSLGRDDAAPPRWGEAADLIVKGMDLAIAAKQVTYDFARLMDGATELKTSEFGDAIIKNM